MAKHILIIDNRQARAKRLIKEQWDEIKKCSNVKVSDSLSNIEDFTSFNVIAVHRSYIQSIDIFNSLRPLFKEKYFIFLVAALVSLNCLVKATYSTFLL